MSAEILNRKCRKWIAFEQDLGFAEALEGLFQQHFGAEIPAPRAVTRLVLAWLLRTNGRYDR